MRTRRQNIQLELALEPVARERGFKSEGEGPVEEAPGRACADARVETLC